MRRDPFITEDKCLTPVNGCAIKEEVRRAGIIKGKSLYPSQDAVDGLLVHVDRDGVFSQARGDGAEVVQRRHPERHFCLFVTELVHLKKGGVEDRALRAGCSTGRHRR